MFCIFLTIVRRLLARAVTWTEGRLVSREASKSLGDVFRTIFFFSFSKFFFKIWLSMLTMSSAFGHDTTIYTVRVSKYRNSSVKETGRLSTVALTDIRMVNVRGWHNFVRRNRGEGFHKYVDGPKKKKKNKATDQSRTGKRKVSFP